MRVLIGLLLAAALAGCTPFARTPDTAALVAPSVGEVPTAWQFAQARVGDVEIGWAQQLGDPVLIELITEAQANNRDLQTALAGLEQARALVRQARAPLLPAINYSTAASEGGPVDGRSADAYSAGVTLGLELDVWGRVRATRDSVSYAAAAVEADYVFAQYSLAAAVAQTYFQLIESSLQEEVARKSLDALGQMRSGGGGGAAQTMIGTPYY
ncbi:MAG: TolC family protein, partial [Pseudomonadota bacterium]